MGEKTRSKHEVYPADPVGLYRPGRPRTASETSDSENSGESDPETHIVRPVRAIPGNRVLATLKSKISRVGPANSRVGPVNSRVGPPIGE
jgi:hypothetical protein